MSYDFAVYTTPGLDADDLRRVVGADPGLVVVRPDGSGDALVVARRTHRGDVPAFAVRGPFPVEPYDVPPEATALALGLRAVHTVVVPGASSAGVRAAEDFSRRLADAAGGVVVDTQLGDAGEVVWPAESRRAYAAPTADALDVVRVEWLFRAAGEPEELAVWWLDLTLRLLPEARPVGFGPTGPTGHTGAFTGRLDRDGEAAFQRAWRGRSRRLGWSSRLPVLDGELTGDGPVRALSVTVLREAVTEPRWRDALLGLLTGVAEVSGAFYAQAQVLRGWTWDARGATPGTSGERPDDLVPGGDWVGLPPEPVWCAWFGDPYRRLVRDSLPAGTTQEVGPGLLHLAAPEPVDRAGLAAARPPLVWWERVAVRLRLARRTWLPAELSAVRPAGGHGALRPARVRPPGLALREDADPEPRPGAGPRADDSPGGRGDDPPGRAHLRAVAS